MTAGVVVMNAAAVALAADSTVTIDHDAGSKLYRGANKLISFHDTAPVMAFWYGAPDYRGVPWEVILKDFRSTNPPRKRQVADYARQVFNYVDEESSGWALTTSGPPPAAELARPVLKRVTRVLRSRPKDPVETVRREVESWRNSIRPRQRVLADDVVDGYEPLQAWLNVELKNLADDLGLLPDGVEPELRGAARESWTRLSPHEPMHTGLVIAGFGEDQKFPGMSHHLVGAPIGDHPRRHTRPQVVVNARKPAYIIPFALNDHVRLFMEGVSPDLKDWLTGALTELKDEHNRPEAVVHLGRLLDQRIDDHGKSVVDAVRYLPKGDLAEFARQMVSFTAFRLRMSMSVERVGEPIDVAVVSRSEGAVWVHRNHYFPPELNPNFGIRYR